MGKITKLKALFGVSVLLIASILTLSLKKEKAEATVPAVNLRASVDSTGGQVNGASTTTGFSRMASKDGRYVVFTSSATNLVSGDTNGFDDIFYKDMNSGTITRVSVDSSGTQANKSSYSPAMSGNGRYITFSTQASLATADTNTVADVYLHDMQTGSTTLISSNSGGTVGNFDSEDASVSDEGRFVAFHSLATNLISWFPNNKRNIFVKDLKKNTITLLSQSDTGTLSDLSSSWPIMSCDGAYVAFESDATNLVSGDTNSHQDVFVVDRIGGNSIKDITLGGNGTSTVNSVSCDGRYISYTSAATNLVSGDTNGANDIFVYDTSNDSTERVSLTNSGGQQTGDSTRSSLSSDGQYIAFDSSAENLVSGMTNGGYGDIFLRDRSAGTTELVSRRGLTTTTFDNSMYPKISNDGKYIYYTSTDTGLVSGDTNGLNDIFRSETGI